MDSVSDENLKVAREYISGLRRKNRVEQGAEGLLYGGSSILGAVNARHLLKKGRKGLGLTSAAISAGSGIIGASRQVQRHKYGRALKDAERQIKAEQRRRQFSAKDRLIELSLGQKAKRLGNRYWDSLTFKGAKEARKRAIAHSDHSARMQGLAPKGNVDENLKQAGLTRPRRGHTEGRALPWHGARDQTAEEALLSHQHRADAFRKRYAPDSASHDRSYRKGFDRSQEALHRERAKELDEVIKSGSTIAGTAAVVGTGGLGYAAYRNRKKNQNEMSSKSFITELEALIDSAIDFKDDSEIPTVKVVRKKGGSKAKKAAPPKPAAGIPEESVARDQRARWEKYDDGTWATSRDSYWKSGSDTVAGANYIRNKAKKVRTYGQRGTGIVSDVADVVRGKPRKKDRAGREKKREWEKQWFKNAAGTVAAAGALAGSVYYAKRHPNSWVGKTVQRYLEEPLRPGMINFDDSSASRRGAVWATRGIRRGLIGGTILAGTGYAIGREHERQMERDRQKKWGAVGGHLHKPRRKIEELSAAIDREIFFSDEMTWKQRLGAYTGAALGGTIGALPMIKKPAAAWAIGSLGAAAGYEGGQKLFAPRKKAVRKNRSLRKEETDLEELRPGMINFDDPTRGIIYDRNGRASLRYSDARGRSARIHSGDSKERDRRKKRWHEKVENERKLWMAGVASAAGLGLLGGPKAGRALKRSMKSWGKTKTRSTSRRPKTTSPKTPTTAAPKADMDDLDKVPTDVRYGRERRVMTEEQMRQEHELMKAEAAGEEHLKRNS